MIKILKNVVIGDIMRSQEEINDKKIKKTTKFSGLRLLFFLIVFILIVRAVWSLFITHPKTEIVRYGNLELSENVVGYIFRNETLIQAPITGQVKIVVPEGTMVKKGVNVITITKDDANIQYSDKVKKIDDEIVQISEKDKTDSIFAGDAAKLSDNINQQLEQAYQITKTGEIDKLPMIKEGINESIMKKLIVTGESGFSGANVQAKVKERENYVTYINSSTANVPTSSPGIISYEIDGYEQLFSPDNLQNVASNIFEKLNFKENVAPTHINSGQPIFKIINNFDWNMVCIFKSTKTDPLKVNDNVSISLENGNPIPAKVKTIKDEGNGTSLVTLQLTSNLEQFYNLRKVNVKFIKRNYEGIKIPTSCITNKDGKRGVIIVDKGITKFKEVNVLGFDQKFGIISVNNGLDDNKGLKLYDEIIVNPAFINEGVLIR